MGKKSFFSTTEVGEILGVDRTTVHRWVKEGRVKAAMTLGKHSRIPREEVISLLQQVGLEVSRVAALDSPSEEQEKECRILLADGAPSIAEEIRGAIDPGGRTYQIRRADSGTEACLALGCFQPNLLILDSSTPGVDAVEVIRQVRASEQLSKLRVLVVTRSREEGESFREAGADGAILKPLDEKAVRRAVRKLVGS